MENNIEIKNVTKTYPQFCLKNVNLKVPKGCIMGLVGENGAGKTTLLKCILNIIKMDKGEITVFGKGMNTEERVIKEDIGVVLSDSFFSDYLKAGDIDKIMRHLYKKWDSALFKKYLHEFKLPEKKIIKEFSTGMKMKLEIATALSHHPKLLILDEPTSGLDPVIRSEILDIFLDFIQDSEKSILLSTHITSDLEHIADYITFINEGEIVTSASREDLLEEYGIIKCSDKQFLLVDKTDILKFRKNHYDYVILTDNKKKFKKKYPDLLVEKPSIEDIMITYIKGEQA